MSERDGQTSGTSVSDGYDRGQGQAASGGQRGGREARLLSFKLAMLGKRKVGSHNTIE